MFLANGQLTVLSLLGTVTCEVLRVSKIKMLTTFGDTDDSFHAKRSGIGDALSCAVICSKDSKCQTFVFRPSTRMCHFFPQRVKTRKMKDSPQNRIRVGNNCIAVKGPSTDVSHDKTSTVGPTANSYSDYQTYSFGNTTIHVKKHQERLNWTEALKVCQREGGSLLKIETRDRKEIFKKHIHEMAETVEKDFPWVGLYRKDRNSPWLWTDGSKCGKWAQVLTGFFKKHTPTENCATAAHSLAVARYLDDDCSTPHRFVCEQP